MNHPSALVPYVSMNHCPPSAPSVPDRCPPSCPWCLLPRCRVGQLGLGCRYPPPAPRVPGRHPLSCPWCLLSRCRVGQLGLCQSGAATLPVPTRVRPVPVQWPATLPGITEGRTDSRWPMPHAGMRCGEYCCNMYSSSRTSRKSQFSLFQQSPVPKSRYLM
jgi:hypothetical protein